jgi:adenylate cyclase
MAALQFSLIAFFALRGQEPVPGWEVLTSAAAHWLKAAMLLVTGLAAGFVAAQIKRQLLAAVRSTSERDRAVSIFGQHVSPQVAEMLLKQPVEYTGEQRNVCVMFLDIRDFSKLAAAHTPNQVMEYLNTLFGSLISIVNQHRGIVNKFLGDGFMAVFGAPLGDSELCESAVAAAKAILAAVEKLNARGAIPPTRVGIGLHVGEALTGNVGSTERKEYTVIGDVVNLASRIEQATKQFQANLIVSEAVRERLDAARHRLEDLGLVELKGQPRPTRLFRVA